MMARSVLYEHQGKTVRKTNHTSIPAAVVETKQDLKRLASHIDKDYK